MFTLVPHRETAAIGYTGYLSGYFGASTSARSLTLPPGVSTIGRRPRMFDYRGSIYVAGMFTRILKADQDGRVSVAGLRDPTNPPTMGASGTGLTGTYRCYLQFLQRDVNGNLLQESNLSPGTDVTLANQGRAWSNLPLTSPDHHATHLAGFVSPAGGLPFRAWERPLGLTTSLTEAIPDAYLQLNETAVANTDGEFDPDALGVLDYALDAKVYHDCAVYIVPGKKGVFVSRLFKPWAVSRDVDASFYPTQHGEQPTGLVLDGGFLYVLCRNAAYVLEGYGPEDMKIQGAWSGEFGCISPASAMNGRIPMWASDQGVCGLVGGEPRNLMAQSQRETWITQYETLAPYYDDCEAGTDGRGHYLLLVPLPTEPKTRIYCGNMRAMLELGSGEPWWTRDIQTRENSCVGYVKIGSQVVPRFALGGADGWIRGEDDTDENDDDDVACATYAGGKQLDVRFRHHFPAGQAGDDEGNAFQSHTVLASHPNTDGTLQCWPGDENAADESDPLEKDIIRRRDSRNRHRTSQEITTPENSGKGETVGLVFDSPRAVKIRGIVYGDVTPGDHDAGAT